MATAPGITPGNINSTIGAVGNSGQSAFNTGQADLSSGLNSLSPIQQYYQGILRGGPQAQTALAPQIANINAGFNAQQQQQAQLYGRGGGRASAMAAAPFQKEAAIGGLEQGLLPSAASGATTAAGLQTQAGLGESQLGQSGLSSALQGNLQQHGQSLQERGQDFGFATSLLGMLL